MFPTPDTENRAICISGVGSSKPFSALMVERMPDIQLNFNGQCFPRYRFERPIKSELGLIPDDSDLVRVDNITDHALRTFRDHYKRDSITKDDIFDYVYGILNAPAYSARFKNSLAKEVPRIPFAPEFDAFCNAGKRLAELHLGYESCEEWPLKIEFSGSGQREPHHFRLGAKPMRFADEARSELVINEHIRLVDIPPAAHWYVVNGRTPLEWFIDRYRLTKDKHSGIVNDPNDWFESPEDLGYAIARIVYLSVVSAEQQFFMPEAISDDDPQALKTKAFFVTYRQEAKGVISSSPGRAFDNAFVESITDLDWIFGDDHEASEQ